VCARERTLAARRVLARARWRALGQRVCAVAATAGACALGFVAALRLGDPALAPHAQVVARAEVRVVARALSRYVEDHPCPDSLTELADEGYLFGEPVDPWGGRLVFGCLTAPRQVVVVSRGADRALGTADDVSCMLP
jgi:hypothetical protein